jgi:DNA-binding YbaB/EbfC family protein
MSEETGKRFGFGLGKIKELQEAFQKAQQVQAGAQELQQELEQMNIEGYSDEEAKLVTVVMSGNQEPRQVTITSDAMTKGAEGLSDLVTAAMKDAYAKSTETMREKMEALTSGLNLPGM